MVGVHITCTPDPKRAAAAHGRGNLGVLLFNSGSAKLPGLGRQLHSNVKRTLKRAPTQRAWDFLSIALAVFAADRFVLRSKSEDGWTRVIALDIAVDAPTVWQAEAGRLAAAFRFLTGDIWYLKFSSGGSKTPQFTGKLSDRDAICLFSGGMDSFLGAAKLLSDGKKPLLVSQGSTKEITPQKYLAHELGLDDYRFEGRVGEKWKKPYEGSTRARSILFFAYGVAAATAYELKEVVVPENGLIAVNPPMTPRRIGSLSTRTTHPHFIDSMNDVLAAVGINVALVNPCEGVTKGNMLKACSHAKIAALAGATYSCGKGKRRNGQCGICVPCIIRRASFHHSGVPDRTKKYFTDIERSRNADDVVAALQATVRAQTLTKSQFARWVARSGPLPANAKRRANILAAVKMGIAEVSGFLSSIRWR